jgi:hypothetical protein
VKEEIVDEEEEREESDDGRELWRALAILSVG